MTRPPSRVGVRKRLTGLDGNSWNGTSLASESLEHSRFAVVDVETTGGRGRDQNGGRILEVAVAILEGRTLHLAFDALVHAGIAIAAWEARLTGITYGLVVGRPRFEDVAA